METINEIAVKNFSVFQGSHGPFIQPYRVNPWDSEFAGFKWVVQRGGRVIHETLSQHVAHRLAADLNTAQDRIARERGLC